MIDTQINKQTDTQRLLLYNHFTIDPEFSKNILIYIYHIHIEYLVIFSQNSKYFKEYSKCLSIHNDELPPFPRLMSETNHVKYYSYSFFILIDLHSTSNLNKSIPHPSFTPPVLYKTCPLYNPSSPRTVFFTTRPLYKQSFITPVLSTTRSLYQPSSLQPVFYNTCPLHNPFFIPTVLSTASLL